MLNAEDFRNWGVATQINGKWVMARPVPYYSFWWRLRDAWEVLRGRADAVRWEGQ